MSAKIEEFDEKARREFNRFGHTVVHRGELVRYPLYTRFLHWAVAISFILALFTGFAIYSPRLFYFLAPLFGGGPMTRFLHPWFSLAFVFFFFFQFLNWVRQMTWTATDSRFMRRIKAYTTNQEEVQPADTGFFNGGQKAYFWAIVVSALLFLLTGLLMWFDDVVPRLAVSISYVIHDIAALVMLAGFIIHIYQGTVSEPGTFRSMISGTVTRAWAWTHHPAWYSEETGRNPREDYERARQLAEKRGFLKTRDSGVQEVSTTRPATEPSDKT
jgi:formate dehydrogenase subunit gamma